MKKPRIKANLFLFYLKVRDLRYNIIFSDFIYLNIILNFFEILCKSDIENSKKNTKNVYIYKHLF